MPGIAFSCGTDSELCFNSGTCVRNDTGAGEYCTCPDGYIHDYVGGRFPNCALPTWFLPAYFAIATAGTIWALFLVLPYAILKVKARLKKAALWYCVSVMLEWLHVLCVFVQQGNKLPAVVVRLFFPPPIFYASYLMFRITIDPVCDAVGGNATRRRAILKVYFIFISSALFAVQASMLGFADVDSREQRETFNLLFSIQVFTMSFGYPVTAYIVGSHSQQLIRTIQSYQQPHTPDNREERLAFFLKQLQALVLTAKALALNLFVLIPVPIVILILGSMPYQFVFWAINLSGVWPTAFIVKKIIATRNVSTSTKEASQQTTKKPIVTSLHAGAKITDEVD